MPYFPDTSVLGAGAISGTLGAQAVGLGFTGPAQSQSLDAVNDLIVTLSGGAQVQNAGVDAGFGQVLNFAGGAIGSVAVANSTATITVNAGAGGTITVVQTGTIAGVVGAINFIGVTGTITVAANTATIGLSSGGSATPGGSNSQVQINLSGALGAATRLFTNAGGDLNFASYLSATAPPVPAAATGTIFAKRRAGRTMLNWVGPTGLDFPFQPHMAFDRINYYRATAGVAQTQSFGVNFATSGTIAAAVMNNASLTASIARADYPTAAQANTAAGNRMNIASVWRGNAAGLGGFFMVQRFIIASVGTGVTSTRFFCGFLTGTATAPAAVDPSTYMNMAGLGKDAADTEYQIMYNDAAGTATKVNTGVSFAAGSFIEFRMFAAPNDSKIQYSVESLIASGQGALFEHDSAASADLPSNTVFGTFGTQIGTTTTTATRLGLVNWYYSADF